MSEVFGSFTTDGERHEMTPENTAIYMHIGNLAVYDHLFTFLGDGAGVYLWRERPNIEEVLQAGLAAGCELHANLRKVAESDEKHYMNYALRDLGDTLPEGWTE